MLTANRKRQFQVRRLALDVCDLYRFSYEISLEEAAILNFHTTAVLIFKWKQNVLFSLIC